jgi:hypothetical protein
MRGHSRFGLSVSAAVTVLAVATPAPAQAGVLVDRSHERFDVTFMVSNFCGTGDTVTGHAVGVSSGSFHLSKDGFPLFTDIFNGTTTYTAANGASATVKFSGPTKDRSVVDNGDGTITVTTQTAGLASEVVLEDGTVVAKDVGLLQQISVIDYNGTPSNPDDDTLISRTSIDQAGAHPIYYTSGRECAYLVPALFA